MNDRFKFRCWDDYNREMLDLQEQDTNPYNISDFAQHNIMQCTGLKDKNGKLIYEGDIVNQIYEDETIYKCEVVYNNCSFQLKHIEDKNVNYINTPMYCYAINYLGHYTEKRLEVIGNIYENKELLECQKQ